jgi:hypothetical protein
VISKQHLADIAFLALLILAGFVPLFGDCFFRRIEKFGACLAKRRRLAILSIAGVAILLRVGLVSFVPIPVPGVHDEFSYLLAADTFAHGRLTNPPHPMWLYFDTFHVNQHPTYMSKYPPAQGAVLAVGELLGHPWLGSLLSVAGMIAAVVWALQAWLPAEWALLGGTLVLLRLGIFGYWIDGYWGGAVAAIGGALVVGALPRIIHFQRTRDAAILGLGESILANSRPFEGLIFSVPVLAVLLFWLFRRATLSRRDTLCRVVAPFSGVILLCGVFMGYYNWRVTGNPLLFPYTVNDRTYLSSTPALLWQKAAPQTGYANPQFEAVDGHSREIWETGRADSIRKAAHQFWFRIKTFGLFFLWPELCVPLLAFLWIVRDRRIRFLIIQTVICLSGYLLVAWFFPHYAAPLVATAFALTIQGLRHLRRWECRGRPIGIGFCRAIVLSMVLLAPFSTRVYLGSGLANRARIAAELEKMPGEHLVIVHYSKEHNSNQEWVYNRADIDGAKVVWARDIPGVDLAPLLNYFHSRRVWVVDADARSPEPLPYPGDIAAQIQ